MKKLMGSVLIFLSLNVSAQLYPKVDIIPTNLKYKKVRKDEFSNQYLLQVWIEFKNVGIGKIGGLAPIFSKLNGVEYSGRLFGEDGSAGAMVPAGKSGRIMFYTPLNVLKHCHKLKVQIDSKRNRQYGGGVFQNDSKILIARNIQQSSFCRMLNKTY